MKAIQRLLRDRVLIALLLVAIIYPGTIALIHSSETSVLDEWVFIDYTDKVFQEGYVKAGERVGEYTNEIMSCSGVIPGSTFGKCGASLPENYKNLPYTGLTAAAAYTPTYFALTAAMGAPLRLVGVSPLDSWRLTGALWLAAAIAVFVALLRLWKVRDSAILPLGLLLIASPYVWWAHSYVSTDAPSLLIGALLLYLATKFRRGESTGWAIVLVSVVGSAIKVTNLVSVGLVVVYLLGSWLFSRFRKTTKILPKNEISSSRSGLENLTGIFPAKRIFWPIAAAIASIGIQIGWSKFITATAISTNQAEQGISSPLTLSELGLQTTNFLSSVWNYSPFLGHGIDFFFTPLAWIVIAGVVGSFFALKRVDDKSEIVTATLIAAVVMAPMLAIAVQVAQGAYFQLSPRYGASLLPAFLLCAGFLLRNIVMKWVLALYACGLFAVGVAAAFALS